MESKNPVQSILEVKVIPNARSTEIVGWDGEKLKIKLNAVPEDGKANEMLLRFLKKAFRSYGGKVTLLRGPRSREKSLQLSGVSKDDLDHWLSQWT